MNKTDFKVVYLGHSAWAVYTKKRVLIFDYAPDAFPDRAMHRIDLEDMTDKQVILFFSHNHHDHYSKNVHEQARVYTNVTSIFGDFGKSEQNTIRINPRQTIRINAGDGDAVTVYSAGSTDAGVSFLVEAEGLFVYHAGDNADWGDGDPANARFYGETDYIAEQITDLDIAFIPVCTFSGNRPEDMTKGALYAIQKLNPALTFPMHANFREHLYKDFAEDEKKAGLTQRIICMDKPGSVFTS